MTKTGDGIGWPEPGAPAPGLRASVGSADGVGWPGPGAAARELRTAIRSAGGASRSEPGRAAGLRGAPHAGEGVGWPGPADSARPPDSVANSLRRRPHSADARLAQPAVASRQPVPSPRETAWDSRIEVGGARLGGEPVAGFGRARGAHAARSDSAARGDRGVGSDRALGVDSALGGDGVARGDHAARSAHRAVHERGPSSEPGAGDLVHGRSARRASAGAADTSEEGAIVVRGNGDRRAGLGWPGLSSGDVWLAAGGRRGSGR